MGHTLNRLEENWQALKPLLLAEWPELSPADLHEIHFQFDKLVDTIRLRYGGRNEIIQEAKIRDILNRMLREIKTTSK